MKNIVIIIVSFFLMVGCSATNDNESSESAKQEESNDSQEKIVSFGEVNVLVENNIVRMNGEAKTNEDVFYFILEQGDKVLLEETEVELGEEVASGWRAFELKVEIHSDNMESEDVPYITLYGKVDGKKVNKHFVPVDILNY